MRQPHSTIPALLLLLASGAALAQGCGPTRLKVAESVTLDMTPARAWARVGDFQDLSWDADATRSSGSGGNAPDRATRTVTLAGGATMRESLYRYDAAAMSYAYHVDHVDLDRLPAQNASGTIEVLPAGDGAKSVVRWKVAFYRNLAPGEGAPDAADARAVEAIRRFVRSGLSGLSGPSGSEGKGAEKS